MTARGQRRTGDSSSLEPVPRRIPTRVCGRGRAASIERQHPESLRDRSPRSESGHGVQVNPKRRVPAAPFGGHSDVVRADQGYRGRARSGPSRIRVRFRRRLSLSAIGESERPIATVALANPRFGLLSSTIRDLTMLLPAAVTIAKVSEPSGRPSSPASNPARPVDCGQRASPRT